MRRVRELAEREKRITVEKMERTKQQLANLPIWVGTECLQIFDRIAHTLAPTTLTQIIKLEKGCCRTTYTLPIDEVLGFLRHPLPENATQTLRGGYLGGIGADFGLGIGNMWRSNEEFKPEGTNKIWDTIGQTAAIRVNMTTREARLFMDDVEQPGIFTGIPSPLCLGITTGFTDSDNQSIKVLWLKRLQS
ncbi:hypothetical protein BLNAU_12167 [Blattamonas nauphoetae]|uniref:Uncharacterized protein n=1 Tax=Blattamonas nauphoetae TaxID=2049346 RepID=A0ABQ9XLD9_9EUKA|nr:hypothetical protein BLNAU_12167 [Blattamonas nauphoetae]